MTRHTRRAGACPPPPRASGGLKPEVFGRHTGGQNTSSVGVSMLWTARGLASAVGWLSNSGAPHSNEDAANPLLGRPSQFQLNSLNDLLDYLQEK